MNLRQKVISILRRKKTEGKIELEEVKEEVFEKEITLDDLTNYISNRIVGQETVIKTLVSNVLYNQFLIDEIEENNTIDYTGLDARKISILLDGPTGTGKTAIIYDIASNLSIPTAITNITRFFESDFTVNNLLYDLLMKANGDVNQAERGIIVLDEFEKIANNSDYGTIDIRKSIQEEIIDLMNGGIFDFTIENSDGSTVDIPFDASKLTFIMCGNFDRLKNIKINDNGLTTTIGFTGDGESKSDIAIKNYISKDIIPEFFERIKVVATTKKYDVEDFKNILLHSEISPLTSLVKTIKKFDYENVEYDSGLVNKLAHDAYDMNVGAKGLQILVSEAQNKVLYDIMTQKYNKNEKICLTKELLETHNKQRVRKL